MPHSCKAHAAPPRPLAHLSGSPLCLLQSAALQAAHTTFRPAAHAPWSLFLRPYNTKHLHLILQRIFYAGQ